MNWPNFGAGFLVGCAVVGAFWFFTQTATEKTFEFTTPDGSTLKLHAKDSPEQLLNNLYQNDFMRGALEKWLVSKRYFHLTNRNLASALNKDLCKGKDEEACADEPVASDLRQLSDAKKIPFHYVGKKVTIGVQSDERHLRDRGIANSCHPGEYLGKQLQLTNKHDITKQIMVVSTGFYTCTGVGRSPDIQLHPEDAKELFQVPLDAYQEAIAVILD